MKRGHPAGIHPVIARERRARPARSGSRRDWLLDAAELFEWEGKAELAMWTISPGHYVDNPSSQQASRKLDLARQLRRVVLSLERPTMTAKHR